MLLRHYNFPPSWKLCCASPTETDGGLPEDPPGRLLPHLPESPRQSVYLVADEKQQGVWNLNSFDLKNKTKMGGGGDDTVMSEFIGTLWRYSSALRVAGFWVS